MNRYDQPLSIPPSNPPPEPVPALVAVALSFTVILIQVQAFADARDLLPVLVAALLVLAGVVCPSQGQLHVEASALCWPGGRRLIPS